ncbi:zinc finger protein 90 isoform X2 [Folsomia candida]|uniref:zinc finger protein 90 isoform X2 n=1 Tax=Folsomia candida TaxID=158441 RepID=UPI001604BDD9|nr:zinc finger protein 90 isoform X2 [Folsomia candida]
MKFTVTMSSQVCFLCFQAIDTTTVEESRKMRISSLGELLSLSSCRKTITQQFEEDESCELCPVCAPVISEMEEIRGQMSALEKLIGVKITEIREIMLASSASSIENRDDDGDKVHKLRTTILKMMGDNDDQQDDNIALDEVLIKVEQDGDGFLGGDELFDDHYSPAVELYNEEEMVKYEEGDDDNDELPFCINPHPQRKGRERARKPTRKTNPLRTKRKVENDSRKRVKNSEKRNPTATRIKIENILIPTSKRRSTRTKTPVLPPKGCKTLTVSLERISVPITKSSPISSPSSSPFHDEDLPSNDLDSSKEQSSDKKNKSKNHNCPNCPKSFATGPKLSYHIACQHRVPCFDPQCNASFSSYKARDAHRKVAHPSVPRYERAEGGISRAQSVQVAERVMDYYKNEANRNSRKTWKFFEQLGIPKSSVYRYLKLFKDKDTITFKKPPGCPPRSELTEAQRAQIVRPYKCSSCQKSFIHRYALTSHIARDHTGAKDQVCHICGKKFYTIFNLRHHLITHDESRRPQCETCGEKFLHYSTLQSHRIREHGADPLVCDECGATFITLKGLQGHKLTHTGLKPYNCDKCDAKFSQMRHLTTHQLSHSDQRRHPCPHCERAFKMKNQLTLHIKSIHTAGYVTPKAHKCPQCDRSFQYPALVKAHVLQAHTGERPFTCNHCGKGFVMKSALTLHLKGKHGIEVEPVVKNRQPRSKRDTFHVAVEQEGDP